MSFYSQRVDSIRNSCVQLYEKNDAGTVKVAFKEKSGRKFEYSFLENSTIKVNDIVL